MRFWGVRGSIPTPGDNTVKYGGNTSCLEVRDDKDNPLIVDAGTGLRALGNFLIANDLPKGPLTLNILLSHTHWDHIQGFPFFGPAYIPSTKIIFYGPKNFSNTLENIVAGQMTYTYFPINLDELKAKLEFNELQETEFDIGDFHIIPRYLNHPIVCLGYRIEHNGKVFSTVYDSEPYSNIFAEQLKKENKTELDEIEIEALKQADEAVEEGNKKIQELIKDADLVIYDAQYLASEYELKKGWGHSTIDIAIENCIKGNVKRIALFHHDPMRTDDKLDEIEKYAKNKIIELNSKETIIFCSREKLEVTL